MKFINTKEKLRYLWNLSERNRIIYDQLKQYDIDINNISYVKKNNDYLIATHDFRLNYNSNPYAGLIKLEGFTERTLPFLKVFLKLLPETAFMESLGNYTIGLSILTIGTVYFALIIVKSDGTNPSLAEIYLHLTNPQSYYEISGN